jgi:hypothetical protein
MTARFSVLTVLRVLVIAMILLYGASIYLEMNLTISPEARQYQADYPDAIRNGFSLMGGLLKLFALAGIAVSLPHSRSSSSSAAVHTPSWSYGQHCV